MRLGHPIDEIAEARDLIKHGERLKNIGHHLRVDLEVRIFSIVENQEDTGKDRLHHVDHSESQLQKGEGEQHTILWLLRRGLLLWVISQ